MSFIQRELDKIEIELHKAQDNDQERYLQLYAARQALSWVLEPQGFKSPYNTIMGIQGDSKDCSELPHPVQS